MGLFGKKNKKQGDSDDLLDTSLLSDEPDVPFRTHKRVMEDTGVVPIRTRTNKSRSIQEKIVVFSVASVLALMCGSAVMSTAEIVNSKQMRKDIENNVSPAFKVRYSELGKEVIYSYFAGKAPVTNMLSTAGWSDESRKNTLEVTSLALLDAEQKSVNLDAVEVKRAGGTKAFPNPRKEMLTYAGMIDGKQYRFTVTLLIPDVMSTTKKPYLVSPPTIEPMEDLVAVQLSADKPPVGEGSMFSPVELPSSANKAFASWASAYAENDGEALKRMTGDTDATHVYKGLGDFRLEGVPTVQWAVQYTTPQESNSDIVLARINFNLIANTTSNTSSKSSSSSNEGVIFPQTMDVMLYDASKGDPNIVAWGPPGSWQSMRSYMNATVAPKNEDGKPGSFAEENNNRVDKERKNTERERQVPGAPDVKPTKTVTNKTSTTQTTDKKTAPKKDKQ